MNTHVLTVESHDTFFFIQSVLQLETANDPTH